jgi:hypothetical protein
MGALLALLVSSYVLGSTALEGKCAQTAGMRIYSNAFVHEETGDLLGYELAVNLHGDSSVAALLFVYEGGENNDGIPIPGHIEGRKLTIEGNWVEHLVEYPSKKEILQTHLVRIGGTLNSASFVGKVKIDSLAASDDVRLKRVNHTWGCKP